MSLTLKSGQQNSNLLYGSKSVSLGIIQIQPNSFEIVLGHGGRGLSSTGLPIKRASPLSTSTVLVSLILQNITFQKLDLKLKYMQIN